MPAHGRRLDEAEDAVRKQAVPIPRRQVAGNEDPRRHERGVAATRPLLLTRANAKTIGDTDGSIIAAIIVTQIPTNQPSPPRSVPGPASIRACGRR